jgi:ABC-type protease/lipase transport system fused ATPase/permease subunit
VEFRQKFFKFQTNFCSKILQTSFNFAALTTNHSNFDLSPTSDMDTLTHLLKASLGTGILAMPMAFSYAGLVTGIFATILTAIICTHCAYVLVKCAHTLYRRTRRTAMNFSEVAEVAFANGELKNRRKLMGY